MELFFKAKKPLLSKRGMHLDLKGHQPTEERLLTLPAILSAMKINVILIEWEDTFCWKEPAMRSPTAYRREVIQKFLEGLKEHDIEPIPLVQTFGHLETLLSTPKYVFLRELKEDNRDLCPSNSQSKKIIISLIDEILDVHREYSRYIHLGGDEVEKLGACPTCSAKVKETSREILYLSHMEPIFDQVQTQGLQPIIWHDMLRNAAPEVLDRLAKKIDLMVWTYGPEIFDGALVSHEMLERFESSGMKLWGAAAFKGAEGIDRVAPILDRRKANCLAWAKAAAEHHFTGVIATGWSRYGTSFVPCQTLEACWDSLVLAAAAMWEGELPDDAEDRVLEVLESGVIGSVLGKEGVAAVVAARKLEQLKQDCLNGITNYLAMVDAQASDVPEKISLEVKADLERWFKKFNNELWPEGVKEFLATHEGKIPKVWLDRYIASQTEMLKIRMSIMYRN
jgi:hypothetical protein